MRLIHNIDNIDNILGANLFVFGDHLFEWEWDTRFQYAENGFSYFRMIFYNSEDDLGCIFTILDYDALDKYATKQLIFIRDNIKDIMQTLRNIIPEDIKLLMADSLLRHPTLGTNFYRDIIR
jgi:hypothetical protein